MAYQRRPRQGVLRRDRRLVRAHSVPSCHLGRHPLTPERRLQDRRMQRGHPVQELRRLLRVQLVRREREQLLSIVSLSSRDAQELSRPSSPLGQ